MKRYFVAIALLAAASSAGADVVLYDGVAGNGTPGDQGLHWISQLGGTQSQSGGVTTLTTDADTRNGYYNYVSSAVVSQVSGGALNTEFSAKVAVSLDRSGDGYTVRFDARLISESHSSTDRAGFSIIALGSDLAGIELGFWEGQVWAQSGADFQHAEEASFDTTAEMVTYQLAVLGTEYTLYADGAELLTGSLRDYSAHENLVYSQSDFLFFGDNTTSAAGSVELGPISVLDAAVPEPATMGLLSLGGLALLLRRRGV